MEPPPSTSQTPTVIKAWLDLVGLGMVNYAAPSASGLCMVIKPSGLAIVCKATPLVFGLSLTGEGGECMCQHLLRKIILLISNIWQIGRRREGHVGRMCCYEGRVYGISLYNKVYIYNSCLHKCKKQNTSYYSIRVNNFHAIVFYADYITEVGPPMVVISRLHQTEVMKSNYFRLCFQMLICERTDRWVFRIHRFTVLFLCWMKKTNGIRNSAHQVHNLMYIKFKETLCV